MTVREPICSAIRMISGLAATAAALLLEFRWITPSAARWAQIDKIYAEAEARHEFVCVWDVQEFGDLRGTRFDAWLHSPAALHLAIIALIAALLVCLATCFETGQKAKQLEPQP